MNNLLFINCFPGYLASGETCRSLLFAFRTSHSYTSVIIQIALKSMKKFFLPMFLRILENINLKKNYF